MQQIDLKDRKILYQLDLNCRQSNVQIGRKVGLSRKVVDYRINRMEEKGIITNYWTAIDSYRFGYEVYRYYIIFQNATRQIQNEIIEQLVKYKNTWTVGLVRGIYDIAIVLWVKSIPEFYQFWDSFNEKYGDYFAEKFFSVYLQADVYPLSYLLLDEYIKSDRDVYLQTVGGEKGEIDKIDYEILNEIVENARNSIIDISKKINLSSQSVNYRIKNLLKKGVIQGFHVGIDNSKLGYSEFKVDIWLREISKRRKIWEYFKYNPNVTFINTSAGYADLEIEFTIENADKLIEIIECASSQFPGVFRKYIYWGAKKGYKLRCLPEMDFK